MCGFPCARVAVLPYPLDIDQYSPAPLQAAPSEGSPGVGAQRLSVLYVGRLAPRKGLETLARAAGAVLSTVPGATIDIVGGETPQVTAAGLLQHIPAALHSRVVFHGRVAHDSLPDYYRRAAESGYELTCFAEPAGALRCQ